MSLFAVLSIGCAECRDHAPVAMLGVFDGEELAQAAASFVWVLVGPGHRVVVCEATDVNWQHTSPAMMWHQHGTSRYWVDQDLPEYGTPEAEQALLDFEREHANPRHESGEGYREELAALHADDAPQDDEPEPPDPDDGRDWEAEYRAYKEARQYADDSPF